MRYGMMKYLLEGEQLKPLEVIGLLNKPLNQGLPYVSWLTVYAHEPCSGNIIHVVYSH